jgi:hypothetical protein
VVVGTGETKAPALPEVVGEKEPLRQEEDVGRALHSPEVGGVKERLSPEEDAVTEARELRRLAAVVMSKSVA